MTDKTAQRTAVREQNTVEKADRAIKNDRCISAPVEAVLWDQYMPPLGPEKIKDDMKVPKYDINNELLQLFPIKSSNRFCRDL